MCYAFRRMLCGRRRLILLACALLAALAVGTAALALPVVSAPPTFAAYRLIDGRWVAFHGGLRKNERTLVLTHGVWQDIATAYPCELAERIRVLGGYDDVIGVSYDWSRRVDEIAPRYAALLARIPSRFVDVEGHSYGGLQSIAAILKSGIVPQNVILVGVPLEGTAMGVETLVTRLIERIPPRIWAGNVGRLQAMHSDGAQNDLLPNSKLLQRLIPAFAGLVRKHHVNVIFAAGDASYGRGTLANWYLFANSRASSPFSEPNDGLISLTSALAILPTGSPLIPGQRKIFRLSHPALRRDPAAMKYIAAHLRRGPSRR